LKFLRPPAAAELVARRIITGSDGTAVITGDGVGRVSLDCLIWEDENSYLVYGTWKFR